MRGEASHGVRAVVIGGYATPSNVCHTAARSIYTISITTRHTTPHHPMCATLRYNYTVPHPTRNTCTYQPASTGGGGSLWYISQFLAADGCQRDKQSRANTRDTQWQFDSHKCTLCE